MPGKTRQPTEVILTYPVPVYVACATVMTAPDRKSTRV
jgi:hypothetical protein